MATNEQQKSPNLIQRFVVWLATVTAVPVGKPDDGLVAVSAGTGLDKSWYELRQEFADALEAWRYNPLARRLVGIVSAYVVGQGIAIRSGKRSVDAWLRNWASHPKNNILLEQSEWCDELTRSGELFFALFMDASGMVNVRAIPAASIERIEWREGDYRTELRYVEVAPEPGADNPVWHHLDDGAVWIGDGDKRRARPIMVHYAVNRPVGAVRGESDLKPILPWLRRYSRWLEDRVVLNAAVRSFIWVVKVSGSKVKGKAEQYRRAPEPGAVMVVDRDEEEWTAVAPNLNARDAQNDGRAIRWMITAAGPGTGLVDLGEGEDANLATANAMGEQRRRFLRRRQRQFAAMLSDLAITSWNWGVELGIRRGGIGVDDIVLDLPDISPADNESLANAADQITAAVEKLRGVTGESKELRELAVRLLLKFAGETVSEDQFAAIVAGKGVSDGQSNV